MYVNTSSSELTSLILQNYPCVGIGIKNLSVQPTVEVFYKLMSMQKLKLLIQYLKIEDVHVETFHRKGCLSLVSKQAETQKKMLAIAQASAILSAEKRAEFQWRLQNISCEEGYVAYYKFKHGLPIKLDGLQEADFVKNLQQYQLQAPENDWFKAIIQQSIKEHSKHAQWNQYDSK